MPSFTWDPIANRYKNLQTEKPTLPQMATLHFGTWNIYDFDKESTGPEYKEWSVRKPLIAKTINDSGLDVVAIQEASIRSSSTRGRELWTELRTRYSASDWQYLGKDAGIGLDDTRCSSAILWRGTKYADTGVRGESTPPNSKHTYQRLTWIKLRHIQTNIECICASSHWTFVPGSWCVTHGNEESQLLNTVRQSNGGIQAILGVDTNDWVGSANGAGIAAFEGNGYKKLISAYPAAKGQNIPSWNDFKKAAPWSKSGQAHNDWIDQIFVSGNTRIMDGGLHDHVLPLTSGVYSDHGMMYATIELKRQ